MEAENHTILSQFFLLGISEDPELQAVLFGLFLSMYLVTVLGNLLIILAISSDSHLHTPMYFFLCNLSLIDICFISTIIPKMLMNIHAHSKEISYLEFLTQVYVFMIFVRMDNVLLTIMAHDRFVVICCPLKYTVIVNSQLCVLLVLMSWIIMFWFSLILTLLVGRSDALIDIIFLYVSTALLVVFPVAGILYSYSQIVSSLMKMSSSVSKYKGFFTCGSHLCVVSLFYGTGLGVYLSSAVAHSPQRSTIASVMYTLVTPMLNPFVYSLRNKDVNGALGSLLSRATSCL
ncbi:Olfactory receptor 7D4 [Sciurus carolinensis]|uniref:Olfactory receptor 7D4 n=1 Tax=Sciurus carolinensis TaxID=30640 RepID=A0AA41MI77_SCICA|nr:Olfactory receptor 7D4 [Sciurus carolinensis]